MRLYLMAFIFSIFSTTALSSDVLISTDNQFGQGFFYSHQNDCFVITPAHVVSNAKKINLLTPDRKKHIAKIEHIFEEDLAILKVESTSKPCGDINHQPINDLDTILTVVNNGEIFSMLEDASLMRSPIDIVAVNHNEIIEIKASDSNRGLKQGYSGSVLYIANSISGILTEVDDGHGYILRFNHILKLIEGHFGLQKDKPPHKNNVRKTFNDNITKGQSTNYKINLT
ncbi:trypsin-like peptidase domain-containing protein, partial [Enterovibrio coralii]